MQIKKVVTHGGIFHPDELSACALLQHLRVITPGDIERRDFTQEDLDDPEVMVLDQGGVYNPRMHNMDHHQDAALPASNILVLDWVETFKELKFKIFNRRGLRDFFEKISDIDRGIIPNGGPDWYVGGVVRGLNNVDDGFYEALRYMLFAISPYIYRDTDWMDTMEDMARLQYESLSSTIRLAVEGEERWKKMELEKVADSDYFFKIQTNTKVIPNWKKLAGSENVIALITPSNREEGAWNLISYDSERVVIPEDRYQTFRHNSGFMAVYPSQELAINAAENIVKNGGIK